MSDNFYRGLKLAPLISLILWALLVWGALAVLHWKTVRQSLQSSERTSIVQP